MVLAALLFAGFVTAQPPREGSKPADDVQDFVFMAAERPLLIRAHVQVDGKSYRAAWKEYTAKVFKFLDINGDGVVDKIELERMPPMQFLTGGLNVLGGRVTGTMPIETVDGNKDGKVNLDEVATFLRRNGAAPFQIGGAAANPLGPRVITVGDQQGTTSPEIVNDAILALLDTSKDGKLSKEELAATPAIFASKDANDDEMLTATEIAPKSAPRTIGPDSIKAAILDGSTTTPGDSRLTLVSPGEASQDLARQLLSRYGAKGNQPGSKTLKAEALGLDATTFARLDADKDGSLDAEELAHFARRMPDVELTIRIGVKADGAAEVEGALRPGAVADAKLTKSASGGMALELGVSRVEVRAGAVSNNTNIRLPFRLRDQYVNQFKAADGDNNGYLDEKEANANRLFQSLFKALDGDGDGMLYERELVAYIDKIEELQKAVQAGCVTLALSDRGSGLFDMLDRDKDGRLSLREMRQAAELAARLDRNGDGQLSRAEVPRNFEMRVRPGPAGSGNDLGNVLVVARVRMDMAPPPERGAGPVWFRKMDSNRDGDLSRREFLGNDDAFKRIDADRDGLISAQEAAAIDNNTTDAPRRRR